MTDTIPDFAGILPAVVTPLDDSLNFCPAAFEKLLAALYQTGIHGIYVCGQTGEGLRQSVAQRRQVAEVAVRCSPPGKLVIVHVGAASAADAQELSKHAARIGASAVSSLPPSGDRPFREIKKYYQELAAASDLPFLVYYFPQVCPAISTTSQILELTAIPNVVGLKFTDYNLYQLSSLRRSGAVVFNGRDEVLVAGLLMKANGGIGSFYNLIPELFLHVYECSRAQRWEEAHAAQLQINELIDITLQFPLIPAIKKILTWSGIDCGGCLPPDRALTGEEEQRLRALLLRSSLAGHTFAGLHVA